MGPKILKLIPNQLCKLLSIHFIRQFLTIKKGIFVKLNIDLMCAECESANWLFEEINVGMKHVALANYKRSEMSLIKFRFKNARDSNGSFFDS